MPKLARRQILFGGGVFVCAVFSVVASLQVNAAVVVTPKQEQRTNTSSDSNYPLLTPGTAGDFIIPGSVQPAVLSQAKQPSKDERSWYEKGFDWVSWKAMDALGTNSWEFQLGVQASKYVASWVWNTTVDTVVSTGRAVASAAKWTWNTSVAAVKDLVDIDITLVKGTYNATKWAVRHGTRGAVETLSKIGQPVLTFANNFYDSTSPLVYGATKYVAAAAYSQLFIDPVDLAKDGQVSYWDSSTNTCNEGEGSLQGSSSGSKRHILYVNGVQTSYAHHCETLKHIHEVTCCDVSGVYNATEGLLVDLWQSASDRAENPFQDSKNKTTVALTQKLEKLSSYDNLELWCHSQGGIICSNSIKRTNFYFASTNDTDKLVKLKVNSYGAAAEDWATGPKYEHFIHEGDMVSGDLGLGESKYNWKKKSGSGSEIHLFS